MKTSEVCKGEFINHSKYIADEVIYIDKYISEQKRGVINSLAGAKAGETQLLISQTGSGKTYTIIDTLKEFNIKSIFIVPNASNVEQIMKEHEIPGAWGDIPAEAQFDKGCVVVLTWDKFAQLKNINLSEYIAIVDEIHQTFIDMYRSPKINGVYENLKECSGRIDITATPNKLDFEIYNHIIEYKPKIQTKYKTKIYNTINDQVIIDIINNSNKFALFRDDTSYLEFIKESINKKVDIVTSSVKDTSQTYFEIVNNASMANIEGLMNTSVIVAGVNINEPNITDIIIVGVKDPAVIKQYVARFRNLKEVNVHIFNKEYNQEISNTYEVEWRINQYIKDTTIDIKELNAINTRRMTRKQGLPITPFKLEANHDYYYNIDLAEYSINVPGIRNKCYTDYYRKADILSFKELIMEYFEDIETVNIQENDNKPQKIFNMFLKDEKEKSLNILAEHKDLLVGANELLKGKTTASIDKYFTENKLDKDKVLEEIKDKNISDLLKIGSIKKIIDLYTKYIVENNFNYELSWLIANKGNRARGKIFKEINIQVFRKVKKKYPELIDSSLIENRLYHLLTREFRPGISYTKEHIEFFIEALKLSLPGMKITEKEIREKLVNIYVIECKQVSKNTKNVPTVGINYYKKIVPTPGTKLNIYTIKSFKKIADIAEEYKLSDLDRKVLNNIINKRYKSIIESKEALELLNIEEIFVS